MNTIQEQWALFSTLVIPANAPAIQKQQMKLAFYAGVESTLRIQFNIGDKAISEDAGVAILEGIHDECRRFAADMATGKA